MCHTQHNHYIITHLFVTLVSFQSGRAPRGGGSSGGNQQPLNISDTILISLIFLQDFSDCVLRWEGSCAATEFGTVWVVGWVGDDFDGIEQTNADTLPEGFCARTLSKYQSVISALVHFGKGWQRLDLLAHL